MVDYERFAQTLAGMAQTLITEYGIADVLYPLCDEVVALLPVTGAGVMLAGQAGGLRFAAASDEVIAATELLQEELAEGPCLAAFEEGTSVFSPDLEHDERFPRFAKRAGGDGIRSAHAFPMTVHGRRIGGLSLYSVDVIDLDAAEREAAITLAAAASAYVLNWRALDEQTLLADQLQHALDSRIVIEQAKGMLAEQLSTDPVSAFEILRRHCRGNGRRLRLVATEIVEGRLVLEPDPDT